MQNLFANDTGGVAPSKRQDVAICEVKKESEQTIVLTL
jgi:hypothetical protein